MPSLGDIQASIGADITPLQRALNQAAAALKKSAQDMGKSFDSAGKDIERSMDRGKKSMLDMDSSMQQLRGQIGMLAGAAGLYKLIGAIRETVTAASDLQEVSSKFDVVFKGQEESATRWAKVLVESYAMSTREAKEYMGSLQDLLKPMGMMPDIAAKMSFEIAKLSADLGSFNNQPTAKVMADIQSALVGNYETMKKYGVVVNESAVKQEALNMGLVTGKEELSAAEKAAAAYSLILKGTADAQGDMSRTAGAYANQLKQYRANMEDLSATLGEALLPALSELIGWLGKAAKAWKEFVSPDMGKMVMDNLQNQLKASQLELAKMEGVAANKSSKTVDKMLGWLPGYVTNDEATEAVKILKARIKNISTTIESEYAKMAAEHDKQVQAGGKSDPLKFTKDSFVAIEKQAKSAGKATEDYWLTSAKAAQAASESIEDMVKWVNASFSGNKKASGVSKELAKEAKEWSAVSEKAAEAWERSVLSMQEWVAEGEQLGDQLRSQYPDWIAASEGVATYWSNIDASVESMKQWVKEGEKLGDEQRKTVKKATDEQENELEKQAKQAQKIYDTMTESIQTSLSDAFQGMGGEWEDVWEGMKSWALKTLADIAAAALTKQIIMPVVMGATGQGGIMGSLTGQQGQGGGLSLGGIGSALKGGFSPSGFSGMQNMASGFALDTLGSEGISQFISGMSPGMFGGATMGLGSLAMGLMGGKSLGQSGFGAAGAGLGALFGGPIGGLAGGFLGDMIGGKLFGGKEKTIKLELGAGNQVQLGRPHVNTAFGLLGIDMAKGIDTDQFKPLMDSIKSVTQMMASTMSEEMVASVKDAMANWSSDKMRNEEIDAEGAFTDYFRAIGAAWNTEFGAWIADFDGNLEDLMKGIQSHLSIMHEIDSILDPTGTSLKDINMEFDTMRSTLEETGGSSQELAKLERARAIKLGEVQQQANAASAAEAERAAAEYKRQIEEQKREEERLAQLKESYKAFQMEIGGMDSSMIPLEMMAQKFGATADDVIANWGAIEETFAGMTFEDLMESAESANMELTDLIQAILSFASAAEAAEQEAERMTAVYGAAKAQLGGASPEQIQMDMLAKPFGTDAATILADWDNIKTGLLEGSLDDWKSWAGAAGLTLDEFTASVLSFDNAAKNADATMKAWLMGMQQALNALMSPEAQKEKWAAEAGGRWGELYETYGGGMGFDKFTETILDMARAGDISAEALLAAAQGNQEFAATLANDIGFALQLSDEEAQKLADSLENAGWNASSAADALKDMNAELQRMADAWGNVIENIKKDIEQMMFTESNPQNVLERMALVRGEITGMGAIDTVEEAERARELYATLLQLGKEAYQRPTEEYRNVFDEVLTGLQEINVTAQDEQIRLLALIEQNTAAGVAATLSLSSGTAGGNIHRPLSGDQITDILDTFFSQRPAQNALGGIEYHPTLSYLAENGPEAIIPLQNGYVPVKIQGGNFGGDTVVHITVQITGDTNPEEARRKARQGVIEALGTPEARAIIKRNARWAT